MNNVDYLAGFFVAVIIILVFGIYIAFWTGISYILSIVLAYFGYDVPVYICLFILILLSVIGGFFRYKSSK